MNIKGSVALVTGANGGIGQAFVRELLKRGASKIYLGARDRFYLDQWRTSVEQRLAQLDKLYSVVHAEVNERRMLWLEIIIVIFFAIDLLILLRVGR